MSLIRPLNFEPNSGDRESWLIPSSMRVVKNGSKTLLQMLRNTTPVIAYFEFHPLTDVASKDLYLRLFDRFDVLWMH